jgi:hypothetical protein
MAIADTTGKAVHVLDLMLDFSLKTTTECDGAGRLDSFRGE